MSEENIDIKDFIKPEPVVIRADNVAVYLSEHGTEAGWNDLLNFKCSRAPFPEMAIHWNTPKRHPHNLGIHVREVGKDYLQSFIAKDRSLQPLIEKFHSDLSTKGLECYLKVTQFPWADDNEALQSSHIIGLDESGKVLCDSNGLAFVKIDIESRYKKMLQTDWSSVQEFGLCTAMATINFMNCRNVEIVDNPPSRQQRRHAERNREKMPVTYKTLVIHPTSRKRVNYGSSENVPSRALHIVRGHFKDYRQGRGLGRGGGHGLWWWSPTVRGTDQTRAIVKDYAISLDKP